MLRMRICLLISILFISSIGLSACGSMGKLAGGIVSLPVRVISSGGKMAYIDYDASLETPCAVQSSDILSYHTSY